MTSISSLTSITLDVPPSCIAFCPTQPDNFVVGTYNLVAKGGPDDYSKNATTAEVSAQKRSGTLEIFQLEGDTIKHLATQATCFAVLDIQWSPHFPQLGPVLAVAASTGLIAIYRLDATKQATGLTFLCQHIIAKPSILVLSIAWHPSNSNIVGFTLSNGTVGIAKAKEGNDWTKDTAVEITELHRHELEAWTLTFTREEPTQVISGGDDSILQCSSFGDTGNMAPLWKTRKLHEAGVTAILPLTSNLLLTGSYDDRIRLISHQSNGRPQRLLDCSLGGGVWRLKLLHGSDQSVQIDEPRPQSFTILASCMHAGTRVLRLRGRPEREPEWTLEVIGEFKEHRSMNYGSDVQPNDSNSLKIIVSTSFYDKLLCLWYIDIAA